MEQEIVYHTNRVVEAEHHLLEIITAITNSVQEPLNTVGRREPGCHDATPPSAPGGRRT